MTDEIDIAPQLPYTFEVTITDLPKILEEMCPSEGVIQLPFRGTKEILLTELNYNIGIIDLHDEPSRLENLHDIRAIAIELIVANEIYNRIGLYVRDAIVAVAEHALALDVGGPSDEKFYYDDDARELKVNPSYLEDLIELSNPIYIDPQFHCTFDVEEITLKSPAKIKSRIGAIFIQLNLIATPVGAPAAASQIAPVLTALAAVTTGFAASGKIGYEIHINEQKGKDRRTAVEERLRYYQDQIAAGNYIVIQRDLKSFDCYNGPIDNEFGKLSLKGASSFAMDHNLDPGISFKNQDFLRELAKEFIQSKNQ